jgi:hypothetical protein
MIRNKYFFYALSFTWGLPLTLVGCIVALALIITKHKPKKWGYCYYFEVGKNWGGLELGPIFIVGKNASVHTKDHEHGHAFHNCWFGPLMPFVISLPSAIRYWHRELVYYRKHKKPNTKYDDVWFEGTASSLGKDFMKWYENNTK